MNQEWSIQHRADRCAATGRTFDDGEYFYTLLFHDKDGYRREDLCEAVFKERNDNVQPFSMWRSKFEPPPPPAPEAIGKQTAEDLLRRYMVEEGEHHAAARYLLAAMLERKRLLKEVKTQKQGDSLTRIYEHTKTGEVFVIPDPGLRLDELEQVQEQVAALLSPPAPVAAAESTAAIPAPEAPAAGEDAAPSENAESEAASETPEESAEIVTSKEAPPQDPQPIDR
jgi:hypothetical protein